MTPQDRIEVPGAQVSGTSAPRRGRRAAPVPVETILPGARLTPDAAATASVLDRTVGESPAVRDEAATPLVTTSPTKTMPPTTSTTTGQAAIKATLNAAFSTTDNPTPKAGRNLFQAIGVGLMLGALVLCSLLFVREIFLIVIFVGVGAAIWEVSIALKQRNLRVPLLPTFIGAAGMLVSACLTGAEGLLVALAASMVSIVAWRAIGSQGGSRDRGAAKDIVASLLVLLWLPFLAAFAIFMLMEPDGAQRIILFLIVPVANDTAGYIIGARFGKHPMLPSISPKKSWEGFTGSMIGGTLAAVLGGVLLLDAPFWVGFIIGPVVVIVATLGDLCESLIKRDLGVKDMGTLLPGHGGVMDRLDSLVLVAPLMYILMDQLIR